MSTWPPEFGGSEAESSYDDSHPPQPRPALSRGTSFGRYLVLDRLGEGAMGVIYKALDPELGRPIALKLMQSATTSSALHERLLREAQSLARLSHPNVIAVHDVGTSGEDVFIAMEFVAGRTLREWLAEQPRSQHEILEVFLAAGAGLAAAHQAGLIHRDFKPDNVMVGTDGRVRVVDFGLARADGDARTQPVTTEPAPSAEPGLLARSLTREGGLVGTPRFMAPEQLRGEAVGSAADQFSFCVSLYWALYDLYPFVGDAEQARVNMLAGIVSDPPSDASVPRWLRQVILRGLRPAPGHRHPSMKALLAALRADPIATRRRWLRTTLVIASAAIMAIAIGAGAFAYRARLAVTEQAGLAQQFGQEVERIDAIARVAASLPLHDPRREMEVVRARMERLEERIAALGPMAIGPGHEALGRAYLARGSPAEALVELEAAAASGYRSLELTQALGIAHGTLYQRALGDGRDGERAAQAHRDAALRYLKQVDGPEYVAALIAFYEGRFADAVALAQETAARARMPYEARTLEGDVHLAAAREASRRGDAAAALVELERAGTAYRSATDLARSGAAAWAGECNRLLAMVQIEVARGESPEANVKLALAGCAASATTRPDDPAPILAASRARDLLANYRRSHGGDAKAGVAVADPQIDVAR